MGRVFFGRTPVYGTLEGTPKSTKKDTSGGHKKGYLTLFLGISL
jgi:hypothetical protein